MKRITVLAALLLLQPLPLHPQQPVAQPQHLRYLRSLALPSRATGTVCVVLDANTFAHTASRSVDDLRLFSSTHLEIPFALTESEAQLDSIATAATRNVHLHNGVLAFDLGMPPRPYSRIDLQLDTQNFYGVATVTGLDPHRRSPTYLGRFTIFDLSQRHLSRSTTLLLPESTFPQVHIELQLWKLPHHPYSDLPLSILHGALVPPSREAQTLFTSVSKTSQLSQRQHRTLATFHVPSHTPVERVSFTLGPHTFIDFLRHVTVTAIPDDHAHAADIEIVTGEISSVELPLYLDADREAATVRALHIDATLAANLRGPATVTVALDNEDAAPLPLQSIELQMRQRTLCFNAAPDTSYRLFYGDDALPPPVYNEVHLNQAATGSLGPEQLNPAYTPRADSHPYTQRHPEILWITLLVAVTLLAATARHKTHHQGRKS